MDLGRLTAECLPVESVVSAVITAEWAAGSHATEDAAERARHQHRLQRAEATFDRCLPMPGLRAHTGRLYAEVPESGARPGGDGHSIG